MSIVIESGIGASGLKVILILALALLADAGVYPKCLAIEIADDLENIVRDKREIWRANPSKAVRRQRRYKKRLLNELLKYDN